MANLVKVTKGIASFFAGTIASLVLFYIYPAILSTIDNLTTLTLNDNTTGVLWLGLILMWILLIIILPSAIIIQGLRETDDNQKNLLGMSAGVLYPIFLILLTFVGWFMITGLSNIITDTLLKVIYWVGLTTVWTLSVILVPINKITNANS